MKSEVKKFTYKKNFQLNKNERKRNMAEHSLNNCPMVRLVHPSSLSLSFSYSHSHSTLPFIFFALVLSFVLFAIFLLFFPPSFPSILLSSLFFSSSSSLLFYLFAHSAITNCHLIPFFRLSPRTLPPPP